ncbi:YfjL-like protein [Intestinibacter sp.]|uniref:YfjL-like protein n=1 Tax=Intestinibacter sp. TaxID=1965304 RepID=UPI002A755871|nr:hypothetical protein [Intestinibacter sp.]MDY2736130.1 hypothetical protein [Intestinibacter sp.]
MKRYTKVVLGIVAVGIAVYIYSGFWGNPIQYLQSKNAFEHYIEEHYKGKVEIKSISYSFKIGNFYAEVKDVDTQDTSYFGYYGNGISDGYYDDTIRNMIDETNNYVAYNIEKESDIFREYMSIDSEINIEQYKYRIYDFYSGEEPIKLKIDLHEAYDFEQKENKSYDKDKFPYKNEKEFLKDAYKIVKILQDINYDFENVNISSFKEDGNNAYGVDIDDLSQIKSEGDLQKIIKNVDYSKE